MTTGKDRPGTGSYDPNKNNYVRNHDGDKKAKNKKTLQKEAAPDAREWNEDAPTGSRRRPRAVSKQVVKPEPVVIEKAIITTEMISVKDLSEKIGKPAAQIIKICDEAKTYGFASVCVNPSRIALVAEQLKGTDVTPCCVVGFPLGAIPSESKAAETAVAVRNGAGEIDMVINIGAAKDGDWALVESDIAAVKAACGDAKLKVIIETCLLTDEEKVKACQAAMAAKADFVKTSTGFSKAGATVADVALMRKTVGPDMGVKAAGGIHNRAEARAMIEAGASRIGASSGIAIVSEA